MKNIKNIGSAKIIVILITLAVLGAGAYATWRFGQSESGGVINGVEEGMPEQVVGGDASGERKIFNPTEGQSLGNPFVIRGQGLEATVFYRLKDKDGIELVAGKDSDKPIDFGEYRSFSILVSYPTPRWGEGSLEIFDISGRDGGEINRVVIPVHFQTFSTTSKKKAKLFFYNEKKDRELAGGNARCDINAVLPVEREIPVSQTPIQDVISWVLEGKLTPVEREEGFWGNITPDKLSMKGANLKDGVLTVEFEKLNGFFGGYCTLKSGVLQAQIEKTVKQFPEVKQVLWKPVDVFQ